MMLAKAGLAAVAVAVVIALVGATAKASPSNMARLYKSRVRLLKSSTMAVVLLHRVRFAGPRLCAAGFVVAL
jgi:hypothetical protein